MTAEIENIAYALGDELEVNHDQALAQHARLAIARLALDRVGGCFAELERATMFQKAELAERAAKFSAVALNETFAALSDQARTIEDLERRILELEGARAHG
jgi:hypothetical protein